MFLLDLFLGHIFIEGSITGLRAIHFHSRFSITLNITMSLRKKNQHQRSSAHSLSKKTSAKHSRKPTFDLPAPNPSALLIYHFRQSKTRHQNSQLADKINALVYNWNDPQGMLSSEVLQLSREQQYCKNYYILAKHQQMHVVDMRPTIETQLTSVIRKKSHKKSYNAVLPHFGRQIYGIVKNYRKKMRIYEKKVKGLAGVQGFVGESARKYQKELTTIISFKQQVQKNHKVPGSVHSESFELRMLSNCIKNMFEKQTNIRDQLGVSRVNQNSWLKGLRSNQRQPSMECDFSSIQMHSKVDLLMESRMKTLTAETQFTEPEELYGLVDLKKKYEQQRMVKNGSNKKGLGHKRNPTDGLPLKKQNYFDPLTPKQGRWSALGSSKNLPLEADNSQSKGKDSYCLTFKKKKKNTNSSKQNRDNLKSSKKMRNSSRSRGKLQFKSPAVSRKL